MKSLITILTVLFLLGSTLLTGCASITKGTTDTVQVDISNCGEPINCVASNKKGSWEFKAPGPVTFKKSDEQLVITCEDGSEVITRVVKPTRGSMAWGNIIFGGFIGGGVDASTDAHWEIADSVLINRRSCYGEIN